MEDSIKGAKRVSPWLPEKRKLGQCAWKLVIHGGSVDKKSMRFSQVCTRAFVECGCVCVFVTEARQDKGENGLDPSEQIKDEPGESKALDVHG